MLREIQNVRQVAGERPRRWFTSSTTDLIIWCDDVGAPVGFQLCYDKDRSERALTWLPETGFSHMLVDDGEHSSTRKHKSTPILVGDDDVDVNRLLALIDANRRVLSAEIVDFVRNQIGEYKVGCSESAIVSPESEIEASGLQ